jgi:hypothetical protein
MPFVTLTQTLTYMMTIKSLYWLPPGMEHGGSRLQSGYLVDRKPIAGYAGRSFDSSVNTLFIPDNLINKTVDMQAGVTSYAWPGLNMGSTGGVIETTSTGISALMSKPYRYGPLVQDAPLFPNRLASCFDDDLVRFPFSAWPGTQGQLTSAMSFGQLIAFSADRSSIPPGYFYTTSGSESFPLPGVVVRVNVDTATNVAIDFLVSFGGVSIGKLTPTDVIAGLLGPSYARIKAIVPAGSDSTGVHHWKRVTGWESTADNELWNVYAPVFITDSPCADFAFDVDFPSPLGNQRVVYSCESCAGNTTGTALFTSRKVLPILTRRTTTTSPGASYARTFSKRNETSGYVISSSSPSAYDATWRDGGKTGGFLNVTYAMGRWDADPFFNVQQNRPIPSFYELDQAVSVDIICYGANEATDLEICWGYFDAGIGWIPITSAVSASVGAGGSPVSITIPAPTSIPSIPGMRYQLLSRRQVAPASSFDAWSLLYSSRNIGGAMPYMYTAICLPRIYPFDAPKQVLIPSSADAIPVDHYGWSAGEYLFSASAAPTTSGTWTCAYVSASSQPWQVNAVATGVSGTPSYCAAWTSAAGYRWRVQLPAWDVGKPYNKKTHFQINNSGSGSLPWRESASIAAADFVIHRMYYAETGNGEDRIQQNPTVILAPFARVWDTVESRVSITIP